MTGTTNNGLVDVVGGQLAYESSGKGEPVVLLHKLGGRIQEWRRMVPELSRHHHVIAMDLTGHGRSRMNGAPPFIATQELLAAQLMSALDSLEIAPPYHLVGSSLGGCVAVVCAALWPAHVASVVSLGSALGPAKPLSQLRKEAAQAIADGQFDRDENPLPRDFSYAQRVFGFEDREIAREQNDSRAEAGRWLAPVQRGVGRFDFPAVLPRVNVPVLLAWGEGGNYGQFVEPSMALLRDARKAMFHCGAFPHEEMPGETLELVLSVSTRARLS